MAHPQHFVFEYRSTDPSDLRVWITYGKAGSPRQPAADSPAAEWLATTETALCFDLVPMLPFHKDDVPQLALLARRIRREQGYTVLSGRVHRGAGPGWRAITIDGVTYRSLRAAAEALGVGRWWLWNRYRSDCDDSAG